MSAKDVSKPLAGTYAHDVQAILNATADGIITIDEKGTVQSFNRAAERIFGYEAGEVVGKNVNMLAPSPYREEHDGYLRNYLSTGEAKILNREREVEGQRKDGTTFPLALRVTEMASEETGGRMFIGTVQDITERVSITREVTQRANQQAAVANLGRWALEDGDLPRLMQQAVALIAENADVEMCKVLELLPGGDTLRLVAGVGWKEGLVGKAMVSADDESQAGFTLLTNKPVIVDDLQRESRFSGPRLLHDHEVVSGMSVIIAGRGRPFGVLGAHTTKRRTFTPDDIHFLQAVANVLAAAVEDDATMMALRDSEERYRHFFERDLAGNYISDPGGRILDCNPAFARIFGFPSVDQALLANVEALYPDSSSREDFLERIRTAGKLELAELQMRDIDGNAVYIIENSVGVFGDDGELRQIQGFIIDVTEQRTLEEQLRQSQKMEAIGQLAGGVAHDFNNLLTGISGYAELVVGRLDDDSQSRRDMEEVISCARRAAGLTQQLLAFGRRQSLEMAPLDVNSVVEATAKMLRRLIGEDVALDIVAGADLGTIHADHGQMTQILLNLSVNARDAMVQGGRLRIETSNVELDEQTGLLYDHIEPGRYVVIAVSDTGVGMDAATRRRIFEPFFTTKEIGSGTGLGLATVYGIVKQHGGHITVQSELGKGTKFVIYLPQIDEEPREIAVGSGDEIDASGSETVLVCEDEDFVRDVAVRVLQGKGYTVISAAHPREAEHLHALHEGEIALLLADIVMPDFDGTELYQRLAVRQPSLKVLYMSGYTRKAIDVKTTFPGKTTILEKPFDPEQLARAVRKTLDE